MVSGVEAKIEEKAEPKKIRFDFTSNDMEFGACKVCFGVLKKPKKTAKYYCSKVCRNRRSTHVKKSV